VVQRLLIDTDTASDDAVALLLSLTNPSVSVIGITVVAGNVGLERAVLNALITVEQAGHPDLPLFAGAAGPLSRPLQNAQFVHGEDGMGDINWPLAKRLSPDSGSAIDVLLRTPSENTEPVTLVTLGPLTNIALALAVDPLLLTRYDRVVMMAGAPDSVGNVNMLGEFNVWADPEAAAIVMRAPGNKTMVGWNISRLYAVVTPEEQIQIGGLGPLGEFTQAINVCVDEYARRNGLAGYDLPDPIAMAIAIDPTVATRVEMQRIEVVCDGEHTRGCTRFTGDPDVPFTAVVWEADEAKFKSMLMTMCAAVPGRVVSVASPMGQHLHVVPGSGHG
jgi:purine nucleosidase